MKYGYARVSTADQNANLQKDALKSAGCGKVVTEQISGASAKRPKLDKLLASLTDGDILTVWRLDRLGRSLPHLIEVVRDLDEKGMLDSTLVILSTEFGRTPKINNDGGRDHYPRVFSIAMAGGGVNRGQVYGESDATSTAVGDKPVSVQDFAKTLYNQLGITGDKELMSPGNRPIEIVDGGRVLSEILANEA